MNKKTILSFLLGMFIFLMPVYAAEITGINIEDGDMIHITSTGNVQQYCIGTKVGAGNCQNSTSNDVRISAMNGHYYVWVVDSNGTSSSAKTVDVTNSCTDTTAPNGTGTGTYTRCFKTTSNAYIDPLPETPGEVASCASGYLLDRVQSGMQSSDCALKAGRANEVLGGIRYCTRVYNYLCEKIPSSSVISPFLSSLSVSGVNLSPSFSERQLQYAAVVDADVSSVTISATPKDSGASYVDGLGPRTVNLNYGTNSIQIKVKSSNGNSVATYTITITRNDNRSSNANLRSLTVSSGTLSPKFNANTVNYSVSVAESVSSIKIGASLADTKSSFVNGYGPRTVNLNYGTNSIQIRVKSEIGSVRTYTINVNRAGSAVTPPTPETPETPTSNSAALLKSLTINDGEIKLEFDKQIFNYNVHIPFDITNLLIAAESEDATDVITVEGGSDLQVGENEVKVTVTGANGKSNVYTLYVIRKAEEEVISSNSYLTNIIVKGKKLKFDAKENEYNLTITEKEKELDITAVPADENSVITVEGNENLKVGSQIKITVTAEDGSVQEYFLNITGIKKSANIFLIIFVVLIIIIVIAYLLLRIMGYRIYFNLDAVKSLFAGNSKKKKK